MDQLQKFIAQVRSRLLLILLLNNLLILADWWLSNQAFRLTGDWLIVAIMVAPLLSLTILPWLSATYLTQPIKLLWQAILHIAPDTSGVPAPNLKTARLGRELIANLIAHVYQLASVAENVERLTMTAPADLHANVIANGLPLPLMVLDKNAAVLFANEAMLNYLERPAAEVVGQNVYSVLDLSFANQDTLDAWLEQVRAKTVTAVKMWERVRLNRSEKPALQFDLAARYSKSNPEHVETMLVFFDHTATYGRDDSAVDFVALAVHELRTPLTLMRGYIEVFDEELSDKLDPELTDFMHKMNASAQQLSAFVNNILNVARIEGDQLSLRLQPENWQDVLQSAVSTMRLRAQVHGITITCQVAPDVPPADVDRVGISEVVTNLLDNAIKYSLAGKTIAVSARLTANGLIETTVQDTGVGIPESLVPHLFSKFQRNYRNRSQIGGTGLGLYLAKAIVSAHGGNIWVQSKEDKGSTFGFTVLPYARLADEQKSSNKDITRNAHGWIKNHSLYRR
jgi:signal transduction histidine kinase